MSMATRALPAAVSRAAGQPAGFARLSPSRRGGGAHHQSCFSHSSAAQRADHGGGSVAAEVEAALNRKNVDVVQGDNRSATLLPDDVADALRGVGAGNDAHDAWVPDQDTGVFVPADEAANGNGAQEQHGCAPPSVLDQAVFVREEEMEDVERPAVDMAAGDDGASPATASKRDRLY